jgi:hypothetical protein
LTQENVRVVPLIVINGPERDPEFVAAWRADARVRVTVLDEADLPAALLAGRKMVQTKWFAELDDDDFLLPGALALRVEMLEERPELDGVVTDGFKRSGDQERRHFRDFEHIARDPVRAMLTQNWLLPGSWLCRSETVGPEIFTGMPQSLECTYLAIRLATRYKIGFLNRPTIVYHKNTPRSVSRSKEWLVGHPAALRRILELELPPVVRAEFRRRVRHACHANAMRQFNEGDFSAAWRWHLQSLREAHGWRSLRYSRFFLSALLRS